MVSGRARVGARRGIEKVASVTAGLLVTASALVLGLGSEASAAGLCATPGGSGAGGTLSGVVNSYYPGVGTAAAGATSVAVGARTGAATPIAPGDLLLVIQMQGASINSTNTDAYGDGVAGAPASGATSLGPSGRYEYVRATSAVSAGSVGIAGVGAGAGLLNSYATAAATSIAGQQRFQVVRVPQHTTATTSSGLTASAWNGSTGGVLALDTTGTLTLAGTVSVDGLGFRGGVGIQRGGGAGAFTDVVIPAAAGNGGTKGEGIAGTPSQVTTSNGYPGGDAGRGAPANAGGGGTDGNPGSNDQNTGGGGGGNGGAGGVGGNAWSSGRASGGFGGSAVAATAGRVVLGGGGGAGTGNNFTAPNSTGAAGGGIVLIRAGSLAGAGLITANGANAINSTPNDGGGGGGAGGSIVLTSPSGSLAGATLSADGGRGGDAWRTQAGAASAHGPGGGGGGGWILTSSAPTATSVLPGTNGLTTTGDLVFGAQPGSAGQTAIAATVPGVSGGAECADVSITKSGPATAVAGELVSYDLTVQNSGPATASGVQVVDTLPAGTTFDSVSAPAGWSCAHAGDLSVTCTRSSFASGGSSTITVVVVAPADGTTITNLAEVTSTSPDPDPSDNSASVDTTVTSSANLSIAKSGPATAVAGSDITYTLSVANAGPSSASAVEVVDTLPAGTTFVSADGGPTWTCVPDGDVSVSCTRATSASGGPVPPVTVVVTAPTEAATLTNTADVSSATPDPDTSDNSASADTDVIPSADLSVVKGGPAEVMAGGEVSYDLVVTNDGPSTAVDVVVDDTLPTGVTFGSADGGAAWTCTSSGDASVSCATPSLAPGATATITVVVTAPAEGASLTNAAEVSSPTPDPDLSNNTSSVGTSVSPTADLSVVKTGPATVVAGSDVTYRLDVANVGPSTATAVEVTDTLPAGTTYVSADAGPGWTCVPDADVSVTCTTASLASGGTATITVVVTAPDDAATITNTAEITSGTTDPDPSDDKASVDTEVTASADLSVVKSGPAQADPGSAVTYSLDVTNTGPSVAVDVELTDTLPVGTAYVSVDAPAAWTCTNDSDVSVTCTTPFLATGATATFTVVVTAPAGAATLVNDASVSSVTPDPDLSDNDSSATTQIAASADLSLVKSGPAEVTAGEALTYVLDVSNAGPDDAVDVVVVDTLPAGVRFVSASGDGWLCVSSGDVSVTCSRPVVVDGAQAPAITVVVDSPAAEGDIVNRAQVDASTADPVPGDNADSVAVTVTATQEPGGGGGSGGSGGSGGGGGGGGSGGNGGSGGGGGTSGNGGLTGTGVPALLEASAALALLAVGAMLIAGARRRSRPRV